MNCKDVKCNLKTTEKAFVECRTEKSLFPYAKKNEEKKRVRDSFFVPKKVDTSYELNSTTSTTSANSSFYRTSNNF